jgi:hypothetical protein
VSEGDALLMEQVMAGVLVPPTITPEQLEAMMRMMTPAGDPFLKAPAFLRSVLLFPYVHGLVLVRRTYESGGYEAVNALLRDPPLSSEQVLHPERLGVDPPLEVTVEMVEDLDHLYRDAGRDTMGELMIRCWLEQWIDPSRARAAARGWGGDAYLFLWPRSEDVGTVHLDHGVVVLMTEWDRSAGGDHEQARQFEAAVRSYLERRYPAAETSHHPEAVRVDLPGEQVAWVERRGDRVLFVEGLPAASQESISSVTAAIFAASG